jgi:exodeoxyribonuclease-3
VPAAPRVKIRAIMSTTVCTLNLNGIRSAEKRGFSRWLKRAQPDHLCLQEMRAMPHDVDGALRSPAGYNTRWNSAAKKGYAGVGLYNKHSPDRYVAGATFDHCADEGRVLRADFDELSIVSLYVPSGSSSAERLSIKLHYLECLLEFTAQLIAEKRPLALCGDINIAHTPLDIARPKQNEKNSGFLPEERAWFDRLLAQGWVDVLRSLNPGVPGLYSWWSNRGQARTKDIGWRLDYVLATPELAPRAKRAWIEKKAGLSDHAPVWVELE